MNVFKQFLASKDDPYKFEPAKRIEVRQLGIKQIVRVKTRLNGDL